MLKSGFDAMKSCDPIDYQRFYQQQSDVCMLRLFDSFSESAPQVSKALTFFTFLTVGTNELGKTNICE